jgi:hypothetical protein
MAGRNMGLHPLLNRGGGKKKHRWMFSISPFIGDEINMLPPSKGSRPSLSFKEFSAEHLNETIYFPGKVEWSNMELSLYDLKCNDNPIFEWMKRIYDPTPTSNNNRGFYGPSLLPPGNAGTPHFKRQATLNLYDGCGNIIESWIYMNAYPQKIDWADLDMSSSELTTVEISIRYDRAYVVQAVPLGGAFVAGIV